MKKAFASVTFFVLTMHVCVAQLYSDEMRFKKLTNIKFQNVDVKNKSYSAILNDNSYLWVKYDVITDTEVDGDYTFVSLPLSIEAFEKISKGQNYNYLFKRLDYMATVLGFTPKEVQELKNKITANKPKFQKNECIIMLDFGEVYNECGIKFNNNQNSIVTTFFFRRLL
ncbi:hypothetical protein [Chitinophaga sp. Cy-1792]|uniref:hypothetical protein n=1 Tax=Chitinophaga sp. Cy-1792 TaxID=2608339 RepID=UPI0014220165|nr:hypothetical protein [Chitinophaga sp. Cy-1792]NIG55381.1 hypothetical protein [Chitinophaga sp. Cy-1792]